jgi:hypothetical protein
MPSQHGSSTAKSNSGSAQTPSAIVANNTKAVAVIVAANSESAKLGTGFFVGNQGLLITNFHVIEGTAMVGIILAGTRAPIVTTKVRGYDVDDDLAVLQVDATAPQRVVLGDSDDVYAGQPVVVVGNPEGLEQTVSNGLISAVRESNGRRLFQISAPISEGSSGSPVFDDHGQVIAVVVSSIEAGQNLNFAVPINYAKPLLEQRPAQPISSLPKRNRESTETQLPPDANSPGASPTLEETVKWLVEKVGAAGYKYCQSQGKRLVCNVVRYEFVEAGDCKLTYKFVYENGWIGQPFRGSSKAVLSLLSSTPDISVSSSSFECGKNCKSDFGDREVYFVGRPRVAGIYFASKEVADRVAKAMNHAIALCGKEPF